MRSRRSEVAAAQKAAPTATDSASSPAGSPSVQSLPGAQASKGRNASMEGASLLGALASRYP